MIRLNGASADGGFLARVMEESGQNLLACIQCGKCTGGCPISSAEVGGPRRLIAQIVYGARTQALEDPSWWYCVACGTCMTRCPVEIDVSRVATALCEIADRDGVAPSEPQIHLFEKLFLETVEKHGRAREVKLALRFNLRTGHPFKDMAAGLKLMRKGALSPGEVFKGGRADERVSRIFARLQEKGTGE